MRQNHPKMGVGGILDHVEAISIPSISISNEIQNKNFDQFSVPRCPLALIGWQRDEKLAKLPPKLAKLGEFGPFLEGGGGFANLVGGGSFANIRGVVLPIFRHLIGHSCHPIRHIMANMGTWGPKIGRNFYFLFLWKSM